MEDVIDSQQNSIPLNQALHTRRHFITQSAAGLGAIAFASPSAAQATEALHQAQGELAGEVTVSSVLLQSRLTSIPGPELDANRDVPGAPGVAYFEWSQTADFADAKRTAWVTATEETDFIVRMKVEGLKAGQLYHYRLVRGANEATAQPGSARQFKTLPAADQNGPLSFCVGSCQNYAFFMHGKDGKHEQANVEDARLGYPVYAAMLALKPDFFIGTGDIVYYDHPAKSAAKTLPELRKKWHEQFRFPRMVEFFSRTPAYWSKDDHDFRYNDADRSGEKLPTAATGIDVFREQMPIHAAGDKTTPTYRTHRVHRHLQLWFMEGRDYRSPNDMPDGPDKTLWGKEQHDWLQRTLQESQATWKIIITPTPMVGPDTKGKIDNHANLQGFRHEADAFFQWLSEKGMTNVMTLCGDRHWQYHSIHPLGLEEFSCGALNVENAIVGPRPGGKNSTDPDGLVKQPFIHGKPTGSFLHVMLTPDDAGKASLHIEFRNDQGKVLYEVTK